MPTASIRSVKDTILDIGRKHPQFSQASTTCLAGFEQLRRKEPNPTLSARSIRETQLGEAENDKAN